MDKKQRLERESKHFRRKGRFQKKEHAHLKKAKLKKILKKEEINQFIDLEAQAFDEIYDADTETSLDDNY